VVLFVIFHNFFPLKQEIHAYRLVAMETKGATRSRMGRASALVNEREIPRHPSPFALSARTQGGREHGRVAISVCVCVCVCVCDMSSV